MNRDRIRAACFGLVKIYEDWRWNIKKENPCCEKRNLYNTMDGEVMLWGKWSSFFAWCPIKQFSFSFSFFTSFYPLKTLKTEDRRVEKEQHINFLFADFIFHHEFPSIYVWIFQHFSFIFFWYFSLILIFFFNHFERFFHNFPFSSSSDTLIISLDN